MVSTIDNKPRTKDQLGEPESMCDVGAFELQP
jgi:hypothetical protein